MAVFLRQLTAKPPCMKVITCVLLLAFGTCFAQEQLSGRVVIDSVGLGGAFVINKQTGKEVKTGHDGSFSIAVKAGQQLVVTSGSTDVREFYIGAQSFAQQPYVLAVEPKSYELDVVQIDRSLTPEALGIVPKGQKRYTPEEKKVLHYQGQQRGVVGFLNWVRGKSFLLKIEERYAKKRVAIEQLKGMYTDAQLVNDLHIPAQFTDAFLFYAVEDANLESLLLAHKKGEAYMLVPDLALKYLGTINTNEETTVDAAANPPTNGAGAPLPSGEGNGQ